MKRLVLIGGGHSHVEVLRRFGAQPMPGVELVLISPQRHTAYSGMLPGLVAGHYQFAEAHIDLEWLTRMAHARFEQQYASGLDPQGRWVGLANGRRVEFDVASIDIGSVAATAGISGAAEHAVALKPAEAFLRRWQAIVERAGAGALQRIVVIGGGAAGVEMLLAMQHRLAAAAPQRKVEFQLVTDVDRTVPSHPPHADAIFRRVFAERGVRLSLSTPVVRVEPAALYTARGERIEGDMLIWATGGAAPPWLRSARLALDTAGFIAVNACLQSISHPRIFAAGDCATMIDHPRPKSGVFAVRAGPPLAANLRAALASRPLRRHIPQTDALALISTGDRYAIATRGRWTVAGAWVWRWKNWIDRRFMRRYAVPQLV